MENIKVNGDFLFLAFIKNHSLSEAIYKEPQKMLTTVVKELEKFLGNLKIISKKSFLLFKVTDKDNVGGEISFKKNDEVLVKTSENIVGDNINNIFQDKTLFYCYIFHKHIQQRYMVMSPASTFEKNNVNYDFDSYRLFFRLVSKHISDLYGLSSHIQQLRHKYKRLLKPQYVRYLTDRFLSYDIIDHIKNNDKTIKTISIWRTSIRNNGLQLVAEKNPANVFSEYTLHSNDEEMRNINSNNMIVRYDNYTPDKFYSTTNNKSTNNEISPPALIAKLASQYKIGKDDELSIIFSNNSCVKKISDIPFYLIACCISSTSKDNDSKSIVTKKTISEFEEIFYFISLSRFSFFSLSKFETMILSAANWKNIQDSITYLLKKVIDNQNATNGHSSEGQRIVHIYNFLGFALTSTSQPTKVIIHSCDVIFDEDFSIPDEWITVSSINDCIHDYQDVTSIIDPSVKNAIKKINLGVEYSSLTILHIYSEKMSFLLYIFRNETNKQKKGIRPFDRLVLNLAAPLILNATKQFDQRQIFIDEYFSYKNITAASCNYKKNILISNVLKALIDATKASSGHYMDKFSNLNFLFFNNGYDCISEACPYNTCLPIDNSSLVGYVAINRQAAIALKLKDGSLSVQTVAKNGKEGAKAVNIPYLGWLSNANIIISLPIILNKSLKGIVTLAYDRVKSKQTIVRIEKILRFFENEYSNLIQFNTLILKSKLFEIQKNIFCDKNKNDNLYNNSMIYNKTCEVIMEWAGGNSATMRIFEPSFNQMLRIGYSGQEGIAKKIDTCKPSMNSFAYKYGSKFDYVYLPNVKNKLIIDSIKNKFGDFDYFETRQSTISELTIPMKNKDEVIGTFNLESIVDNAFDNIIDYLSELPYILYDFYFETLYFKKKMLDYYVETAKTAYNSRFHFVKNEIRRINEIVTSTLNKHEKTEDAKAQIDLELHQLQSNLLAICKNTELSTEIKNKKPYGKDLKLKLDNTHKIFKDKCKKHKIKFNYNTSITDDIIFSGLDLQILGIAVEELLNNAIDKARLTIEKFVSMEAHLDVKNYITIEIFDSGVGFKSYNQNILYDSKPSSSKEDGTGIGLKHSLLMLEHCGFRLLIVDTIRSKTNHPVITFPYNKQTNT